MNEKLIEQTKECFETTLKSLIGGNRYTAKDLEFATKLVCAIKALEDMGGEGASFMSNRSYEGNSNRSRRSYRSYNNGYSGHDIKAAMREKMEELMSEADSDMDRRMVEDMMSKLEGMR